MQTVNESYNGYLVVASRKYSYYKLAINCLESIKDYYPEANLCLVTEEKFCDGRERIADHVIHTQESHYRSKLWGMSQTPFDVTMYVDADMECAHEDISKVFDLLGDNDMMFKGIPEKIWPLVKDVVFPGGMFKYCGAVCLYRSSPLVNDFMKDWYEYYKGQYGGTWWPTKEDGVTFDTDLYPYHLRQWDQFTLWWLTEKEEKYKDLKTELFDDDTERLNAWDSLERLGLEPEDPILLHRSLTAIKS